MGTVRGGERTAGNNRNYMEWFLITCIQTTQHIPNPIDSSDQVNKLQFRANPREGALWLK